MLLSWCTAQPYKASDLWLASLMAATAFREFAREGAVARSKLTNVERKSKFGGRDFECWMSEDEREAGLGDLARVALWMDADREGALSNSFSSATSSEVTNVFATYATRVSQCAMKAAASLFDHVRAIACASLRHSPNRTAGWMT
jgi:hypothetical protein